MRYRYFERHVFAALMLMAVGLWGGEAAHEHVDGEHAHESPHGGVVVPIGKNHAELVYDSKTGGVVLYVMGGDGRTASAIESGTLTAQFRIKGVDGFQPVKLSAMPLAGEAAGVSSRFNGASDSIKGAQEFDAAVSVPIGGAKLRAKFSWKAGDVAGHAHGADGHAHSHEAGPATIQSRVRSLGELKTGVESEMRLTLQDSNGKPVSLADLVEVHTRKIHLLIVDSSLKDYQHIHPDAVDGPGEYAFRFTPVGSGNYVVFSDLHPVKTNRQEYSTASFEVPGVNRAADTTENVIANAGGFVFTLNAGTDPLRAGEAFPFAVSVTNADGTPFAKLEPVMGAFAHAVAFNETRKHVLHIHPLGREPERDSERGGPMLEFNASVPEPGYWKLYIQVQVGGKDVFAAFGLKVLPGVKKDESNAVAIRNKTCPITGKPVHSMQKDAHLIYKDRRVELCCGGCEVTFKKSPEEGLRTALESVKN